MLVLAPMEYHEKCQLCLLVHGGQGGGIQSYHPQSDKHR